MANYRFVVDNHYEPFTFQEMLVPWAMYKDAFEKADDAYTELQNKADVFKYLSKTLPENSEARKLYEGYANEVKEQAAFLNAHGYGANSRRALSALKKRFEGEIGMLEKAEARRKKLQDVRDTLAISGKPMIYNTDNFTIDDFLYERSPNPYGISTDDLYTKGVKLAQAITSRMYDTIEGGDVLGGYYSSLKSTQGMSPAKIAEFMNSPELDAVIDQKLRSEGVADNLSGAKYQKAKDALKSGVFEGIVYAEKTDVQRNPGKPSWTDLDTSKRGWANIALNEREQRLNELKYADERSSKYVIDPKTNKVVGVKSAEDSEDGSAGGPVPKVSPIFTTKELKDIDDISKFSQYFYRDDKGGLRLSKKGYEEYNKVQYASAGVSSAGTAQTVKMGTPFRAFLDKIGAKDDVQNKRFGLVGNTFDKYVKSKTGAGLKDNSGLYDATSRVEYSYPIDSTQQKEFKGSVLKALGDLDLREQKFSSKDNKFVTTSETLSKKKLNTDDYEIGQVSISPYGNSVFVKHKDGSVHRYELPNSVDYVNMGDINRKMEFAKVLQDRAKKEASKANPNVVDIAALNQAYTESVQEAYMMLSQLFLRNKTKEQEFGAYNR